MDKSLAKTTQESGPNSDISDIRSYCRDQT